MKLQYWKQTEATVSVSLAWAGEARELTTCPDRPGWGNEPAAGAVPSHRCQGSAPVPMGAPVLDNPTGRAEVTEQWWPGGRWVAAFLLITHPGPQFTNSGTLLHSAGWVSVSQIVHRELQPQAGWVGGAGFSTDKCSALNRVISELTKPHN